MGFLKKIGKAVTDVAKNPLNIVAPLVTGLPDLGLKLAGNGNGLFGEKGGPANPFNPADPSSLFNTSRLDFLKNNKSNADQYDFLKNTRDANPFLNSLVSSGTTFADNYQAPTRTSTSAFTDYLSSINAPSSVDQVQRGVDSDLMNQLLEGIGTDTRNTVGSLKSDFADRGLSGPGMISDIEANALAQAYSGADKNRASVRGEFATKELERMKAQELAKQAALGQRYGTEAGFDTQNASIAAQGALSDSSQLNNLLSQQSQLAESGKSRELQQKLGYAGLLQGEDQQTADANNLFAQLLNARDLGAYNVSSQNFNSAADRELAGRKPSLFDQLLNKVNFNIGV